MQGLRKRAKHKVRFNVLPRTQPRLAKGSVLAKISEAGVRDLKQKLGQIYIHPSLHYY